MSESAKRRLMTHVMLTSHSPSSYGEVIRSICRLVNDDGPESVEMIIDPTFPFLTYIVEAAGAEAPPLMRSKVYVSISKRLVPDLDAARRPFIGLVGKTAAEDMYPDWCAEDLYTEVELSNAPSEFLFSDQYPAYDINFVFSPDGTVLRSRAHIAAPATRREDGSLNSPAKRVELPADLTELVSRILLHQVKHARSPRPRQVAPL